MLLVVLRCVPGGEIDDVASEKDGVGAGFFWEVNLAIITLGRDGDLVPKFFETSAVFFEFFQNSFAVVDKEKFAQAGVFEATELAQGKLGPPVGDGGVEQKFGVAGALNPFEL